MLKPPKPVETLPSLKHNDVEIICRIHFGFQRRHEGHSLPRYLYGAVSPQGERHWRNNLEALKTLIDNGFTINKEDKNGSSRFEFLMDKGVGTGSPA